MHFLVIGCGSIGQRHIRNLKKLGHEVRACESNALRAREVGKTYNIEVFSNIKEALSREYDGAFVCTPTSLHIPISIKLAEKGIHLFIEKPLSHNLKRLDELLKIVKKRNLVNMAACNTRFLPSFKFVKELIDRNKIGRVLSVKVVCGFYLPSWHPYEDYRKGYSAKRHLGGGVIFDDIHEIDSLRWIFGKVKEVFCFAEKISDLKIDTEDIAEIFLKFKSGTVAEIHLDYLQRTYRRYYEFIGEKGTIIWDYAGQSVRLESEKTAKCKVFNEKIGGRREIMFIDEIRHFIDCIKGGRPSLNDISSAKEILEIALTCHESARKKEVISL